LSQLRYFGKDIVRLLGRNKWRIFIIIFSRTFIGIGWYRFERSLFSIFGKYYSIIRLPLTPISFLQQAFSNLDIHYKADIGPGLLILHPSVGIVISGQAIIGKSLTLTGGNVIGATKQCKRGEFVIGDNCEVGANAVIIGPLLLGNNVKVGASACVVKSFTENNITLLGVPAKIK